MSKYTYEEKLALKAIMLAGTYVWQNPEIYHDFIVWCQKLGPNPAPKEVWRGEFFKAGLERWQEIVKSERI